MTNWLFFGLCTLVDLAISVLFPGNFLMNDLVFLPSVGFCSSCSSSGKRCCLTAA